MSVEPITTVAHADQIAERFHRGQIDKSGRAYIGHPRAVAAKVAAAGGDVAQQMAALLHDVVEDTAATATSLAEMGVPAEVVDLVDAMTHRAGESQEDYLTRLARTPRAVMIKRADIAHNSDPDRMARLNPATRARLRAKYAGAVRLLDKLTAR